MENSTIQKLLLILLLLHASLFRHATVSGAPGDMPLKQCPGLEVAQPSWLDQQEYGYAELAWDRDLFKDFDSNYGYLAYLYAPYVSPGQSSMYTGALQAEVRKSSITTPIYRGYMYVEQIKVSSDKLHCIKDARGVPGSPLSMYDKITSATYLGSRHIMITTNGSSSDGGSQRGRVILIDYPRLGDGVACDGTFPTYAPSMQDVHTSARQIYPFVTANTDGSYVEDPVNSKENAIHGCHADSYADESLAGLLYDSKFQPFYIVCMTSDTQGAWWLRAFRVELHVPQSSLYDDLMDTYGDVPTFRATTWIKSEQNITEFKVKPASAVHTFPVHVIGKKLVLYRCFYTMSPGRDVHWCWRRFESNLWGTQYPALTTAVLAAAVLQKGMFIGWSGNQLENTPNSTIAYFLDRSARRLYTLAVDEGLTTVFTDLITGIVPGSSMTAPIHTDLVGTPYFPAYGQVNHMYDLSRYSYYMLDEILYLVHGARTHRYILLLYVYAVLQE